MPEKIALYPRVSTAEQAAEGYSIQEQIDRMTKYCDAMGWRVHHVYTDAGYSGSNMDRPALKQLIHDVKAGNVTKVLVYKLDRLSRSQKDTLLLIEDVFLKNNVDFVSMNENFDTATPFGRAMVGVLAVFAQLEREQIRERMSMGKDARAKEGKYTAGGWRFPIGYDYVDGQLVVNEFEKLQVVRAFEMCADGIGASTIATSFNKAGLRHKYGEWLPQTVRTMLRKRTYLGYVQWKGEWYKGKHDALVSEELFNSVQRVLDNRKEEHEAFNRRIGRATSYLGGYLVCGCCGAKYAKTRHRSKQLYVCNSRSKSCKYLVKDPDCKNKNWSMEELDNLIFDQIRKLTIDPSYTKAAKKREDGLVTIREEIRKLDDQLSRLMDLYTIGEIPFAAVQERVQKISDQKHRLEIEAENLAAKARQEDDGEDYALLVKSFSDALRAADFDEIRSIIGGLIDFIELNGDDVTIHWKFA